ncbi:peptidoglycan-binding protein [Actinomadura sp. GTD37]|uniref:peptidoglycan-binding domain-containing protein n=1 Tax=Actinomadura sp. GTD37 TaxID=1778030 RepID=UPI0035C206C8
MNQDVMGTTAAAPGDAAPLQWAPWLQRGLGGKHRRPRRTIAQVVKRMPPFPRRTLKYQGPGMPIMHGLDVELWQRQMCKKGYTLHVDGWYGHRSSKVAASLQRRAGLVPDGEIDAWTWAAAWD